MRLNEQVFEAGVCPLSVHWGFFAKNSQIIAGLCKMKRPASASRDCETETSRVADQDFLRRGGRLWKGGFFLAMPEKALGSGG